MDEKEKNITDGPERRYLTTELRAVGSGEKPVIRGYAANYEQRTQIFDFYEEIAPGAFRAVLESDPDVVGLLNHDNNQVLGRTSAGTMTLREDENGLFYEISINEDDREAMNTYAKVARGDIKQSSFAFTVKAEQWTEQDDDYPVRRITEVGQLFDVSPVTYPAYPTTSAAVRSLANELRKPPVDDQQVEDGRDTDDAPQQGRDLRRIRLDLAKRNL